MVALILFLTHKPIMFIGIFFINFRGCCRFGEHLKSAGKEEENPYLGGV